MTPAHEALMWRGITPPRPGSLRTTCPQCSHTRKKSTKPCLRVFTYADVVEWRCHHCGYQDEEKL